MSNGPTTPFKTSTNSSTHSNKSGVEPPRFNFSNVSSNNHFYAARVPEQDASKYSLYALKELHKYQHSLCIGLNYLHCSIEIIDAIVPKWKASHHGQFDPPASFRSSEQRLKTWRRHTTSQERQLSKRQPLPCCKRQTLTFHKSESCQLSKPHQLLPICPSTNAAALLGHHLVGKPTHLDR